MVSGAPGTTRTYDLRLRRPLLYPAELRAQRKMVGETGFEPATPCAQDRCATRLRYSPTKERFISHLLSPNQAFDCMKPFFTRKSLNASAALPLWLILFLISRDSSASVFPYSGTMKRGS